MARASSSRVLFAAAAALAAAGCAPGQREIAPLSAAKPEWVAAGSGVFVEGGRKVFRGVGQARGIRNQKLAMAAARDRATAEISRVVHPCLNILLRGTMGPAAGAEPSANVSYGVSGELIGVLRKAGGRANVVGEWRDSADGSVFVLRELDLDGLKRYFNEAPGLDARTRDFLRDKADKAFDEVAGQAR